MSFSSSFVRQFVRLKLTPIGSETRWNGELWSKTNPLNAETKTDLEKTNSMNFAELNFHWINPTWPIQS